MMDKIKKYNERNNVWKAIKDSKLSTANKIAAAACVFIGSYVITTKIQEAAFKFGEEHADEIVNTCKFMISKEKLIDKMVKTTRTVKEKSNNEE